MDRRDAHFSEIFSVPRRWWRTVVTGEERAALRV